MLNKIFKESKKLIKSKIGLSIIILLIVGLLIYFIVKVEQFCFLGILGDCTTKSVTKVVDVSENIMQIDASIRQNVTQNCLNNSSASNVLNIIDSKLVNASISQQNILKNLCVLKNSFDSNVNVEAQQKLAAAIAQYAKSKGGFMGAPASSESVTESITRSSQEIDASQVFNSVKNCMNNLDLDNVINIINSSVTSSSIEQINNSFFECLASDETTAEIAAEGKQEQQKQIDQKAESESVDVISSLFTGFNIFFIGIGLVLVLGLIFAGRAATNILNTDSVKSLASNEDLINAYIASKSAASTAVSSPT